MSTPTVNQLEEDTFNLIQDSVADGNAEEDVLSGPCVVENIHCENGDASTVYLKLYDSLDPDVGTLDPDYVLPIPSSAVNNGFIDYPGRFVFNKGLSFVCVTTPGTGGSTGPTGSTLVSFRAKKGVS